MASNSSSPMVLSHVKEKIDLESVRALVATINQHLHSLLANGKAWKSLKLKCTSKLKIQNQEFFEFADHSVMSNLYWGIESIEAAMQEKLAEEKASRLKNSENLLQLPASLDEDGVTAGIPNNYLVSCSYFYLSIVRKLEEDEWQVAVHFLQALLVSPRLVYTEFAPKLCQNLFLSCTSGKKKDLNSKRRLKSASLMDFEEDEVNEVMRWIAREYKARLMYYQIMSYGDTTQRHCRGRDLPPYDAETENLSYQNSRSTKSSHSCNPGKSQLAYHNFEQVHPLTLQENIVSEEVEESMASNSQMLQNHMKATMNLERSCHSETVRSSSIRCLKDILSESESDTPISFDSHDCSSVEENLSEQYLEESEILLETGRTNAEDEQAGSSTQNQQALCSLIYPQSGFCMSQASGHLIHREASGVDIVDLFSERFSSSFSDIHLSELGVTNIGSYITLEGNLGRTTSGKLQRQDSQEYDFARSKILQNYHHQNKRSRSSTKKYPEEHFHAEQAGVLEKIISRLCFSEEVGNFEEDYTVEITTIYEILNNKTGLKYTLLKDVILDQLLRAISTSKEDQIIRASVCILSTIISANRSIIEDIKRKGLRLYDLATALKRNVHEAATLIYLINPSPAEIKTLELLPCLVEIVCTSRSYKLELKSLVPPSAASLMIIEVLVTAFDYTTNNMHLAVISSPKVLSGMLDIPRNDNIEEFVSLAAILVRCMQFDGRCKKYISEFAPVSPLISLLRSNQKRAAYVGLQFFHELLRVPRSTAINILQQMRKEGSTNNMCVLLLHIQNSEPEYKLLAGNILLQLDMLEDTSGKIIYREAAVEALLESVKCERNSAIQALSAFILSNIGGTYSWMGEPYTIAWLVKKAGLTSIHQKNMIRNFDFSDQSLHDPATDTWSSKLARCLIKFGIPVFYALEKGLKSKSRRVSRDSLTAIAWLGCEIVRSPGDLRYAACEIILSSVEQFIHPGMELEERILACLCIYNYTYGRGMKKLFHFSEGVRESLRRLSGTIWMAEELLKVAEYLQPDKWRISCVHTQILEAGDSHSGAVTALIYYKGQLCSGYADGSIKVWDIKGQTATLVWERKEHEKAVTCFSILEPGNCLLSGSSDKTIKIWHMVQTDLECIEVIKTKDAIESIDTCGEEIFAITKSHKMKVFDKTRKANDIFKSKRVKCMRLAKGKVYAGCMDSSIQELAITHNRQLEIRAPSKKWVMQSKPINSLAMYKDWLYSASVVVEGSKIKEWKRSSKPQISIVPERGSNILAMEVVEDFIYLNCSTSTSNIQIWLRGTQHKVGRLSAGSRITSLLSANDMIICGTAAGLIKGWIPL